MPVRPARIADAAALASLHVEGWKSYRGLLPDAFLDDPARLAGSCRRWRSQVANPGRTEIWVAESAGAVAGFTSFGPCLDDLGVAVGADAADEIIDLWVTPALRSRGIGSALLAHAMARCARPTVLWVLRGNERARDLYSRHGFRTAGLARTQQVTEYGGFALVDELMVLH